MTQNRFFLLIYFFSCHQQKGDENSIINWIYDRDNDKLKTEEDDEVVTVDEVKRKMEELHLNR